MKIARFLFAIVIALPVLAACAPDFKPPPDYQGGFLWDSDRSRTITVGSDDTLYSISQRYDVPVRVIIARNNLQVPYALRAGQTLILDPIRMHDVKGGETLQGVAERYHVPQSAIVETNNLQPPYAIHDGERLWIPDPFTVAAAEQPIGATSSRPQRDTVAPPMDVMSAPPRAASAPITSTALAPPPGATAIPGSPGAPKMLPPPEDQQVIVNPPQPDTLALEGQARTNPPVQMSLPVTQQPAVSAPVAAPAMVPPVVNPPTEITAVPPAPLPRAPVIGGAPLPPQPQTPMVGAQAAIPPASATPSPAVEAKAVKFVWPVKGRLISGFGPAGQGLHNDGINIAAPMGAQIRAAGSGTVVYAGNELKGFGNLLLIKHDNGLTTAYAHAEKLLVAKGDAVKQGQVIATVGKSGNVNAPQLHFEVRRGTQAVDPQPFLQR